MEGSTSLNENIAKDVDGWTLVFEEHFDDSSLRQWNIWKGGAYNKEIQYYQPEQLKVQEGILNINIQRETITGEATPENHTPKVFEYSSGRIESKKLFGPSNTDNEREYRFKARIKMPMGHGMWPAFWTYGDPWPTQGEIDIVEARGNQPNKFSSNIFYGVEPGTPLTKNDHNTVTDHELDIDITESFHEYELIWGIDYIEILFDGKLLKRYEATSFNYISELADKKQKITLNTAVGGLFFPAGTDSATFVDKATMQIDWVMVYKR